ncbi:MAG: citrulline utilization hydrolase CtlX [Flammeovirgaceae bacterium]
MRQRTSHIMMIRPAFFGYNEQTAKSNAFQNSLNNLEDANIQAIATQEFEQLASEIKNHGVTVNIIDDSLEPKKPDAIFCNNWVSFHDDGTVILYPVCTPNRRWERRRSVLDMIGQGYHITNEIDFSHYEEDGKFLESTGSMILDRQHKVCYACLAIRTDKDLLQKFSEKMGYELVVFDSVDENGIPIYHTNVMMGLAMNYVVICMESIKDEAQRNQLIQKFKDTNKEIVDISLDQVKQFCGNVIELENKAGASLLIMSDRARHAFTPEHKAIIERHSTIVSAPINTIEKIGGGGARCMVAEVFLPPL